MKRLGFIAVLLMVVSASSFAAARFTTTSEMAMGNMGHLDDPDEARAKAQSPEVQKMIQDLRVFLDKQNGKSRFKVGGNNAYIGSEYCMACHTWSTHLRDTKHMQALRRPMAMYTLQAGKGVVADYDQNGVDDFMQGLDMNEISSGFDQYKPHAPVLSYEDETYYITIGELKMPVVITQGGTGNWKQRYLVRVPVTDTNDGFSVGNYVSPIQFNEKTFEYVVYHGSDWYDAENMPRFGTTTTASELVADNSRQYSKKCIGCHTTGIRSLAADANGEWVYGAYPASLYNADDPAYLDYDHDGIMDIVNVGCEACHGPGGNHVLGAGDPDKMVGPENDGLTTKQINDICAQCHVRVKSVPNGTHDWPMMDDTYTSWMPGSEEPIENYYTNAAGYWGDGIHSKQHHQQSLDFDVSGKPTFAFHMVTCVECHSPHSARGEHQTRTSITEETDTGSLRIPTEPDNNTLCLACHATHGAFADITKEMVAEYDLNETEIGSIVSKHTNHPYGPERHMGLSRCTMCHMPKTAKSAIDNDIHSHTFQAIAPKSTLDFEMPNSCALSCHNTKVNSFGFGLDSAPAAWNTDFDVKQANKLGEYFGLGGKWWDTTPAEEK